MMEGNLNSKQLILPIVLSISLLGCGGGGSNDDQPNPNTNTDLSNDSENTAVSDSGGESTDTDNPIKGGEGEGENNQDIDENTDSTDSTDSDDENQTEEDSSEEVDSQEANRIMSSVWMGNTCSDYGDGIYFKSLYQFGDDGKFLVGVQSFEDADCDSRSDVFYSTPKEPEYYQVSYRLGDQQTLPDGTDGYGIYLDYAEAPPPVPDIPDWPDVWDGECDFDDLDGQEDIEDIQDLVDDCDADGMNDVSQDDLTDEDEANGDETNEDSADEDLTDEDEATEDDEDSTDDNQSVEAYFRFLDEETLCFSNNILIDTEVIDLEQGDGSSIDYDHCLTHHSTVDDQPPSPQPDPDTGDSPLQNHYWLGDDVCYHSDGEDGSYMRVYEFTSDNRVINTELVFATSDCTMEGEIIDRNTQDDGGYNDLGEETLSDGTVGHRIEISNLNANTEESLVGFYVIDQTEQLCLSYNLGINNDASSTSTDIDYEHCLISIEDE